VDLPLLRLGNEANWAEFWTQVGPKIFPRIHLSGFGVNQELGG